MFYQNWKLSFICNVNDAFSCWFSKILGKRIGKATAKAGESSGNLNFFLMKFLKDQK